MIFIVLVVTLSVAQLRSQEKMPVDFKGRFELSPSLSFNSIKDNQGTNVWYLVVPVSLTYYVSRNIGLGGELLFTEMKEDGNMGIISSLILQAGFPVKEGPIPYFLAGVGLGNSSYVINQMVFRYNENSSTYLVFTAGMGIKIPLTKSVMGNIDLRYQHFSGKETYEDYYLEEKITEKVRTNCINSSFGISLFL